MPMGTLADRIGNRKVLLIGLVIFGLASVLAAFSVFAAMLIAARVLLSLGGAMIVPCVLGSIRRAFNDDAERAMALGVWGAVGSAGAAMGPLVDGLLLEQFWWGSVFLINVPYVACRLGVLPPPPVHRSHNNMALASEPGGFADLWHDSHNLPD